MQSNILEFIKVDFENYKNLNFENFLWRIRNNPVSRKFSVETSYISHLEHREWVEKKLKSNNSIIYIIKVGNENGGVVRFEKLSNNKFFEVSIILAPEYRGYKLSEKILKQILNKIYSENKVNNFLARIHKDNVSSKKIFNNLGFVETNKFDEIKNFNKYELTLEEKYKSEEIKLENKTLEKNTVGIMQPTFLPWLGYFALMEQVDYFVLLDDVQFSKQSWQVRNRIKNNNQDTLWLSLPVKKHSLNTPINKIEISDDERLVKKILNSFEHNYSKSEYFNEAYDLIYKNIFNTKLSNITTEIIEDVKNCIGISTPVYKSSDIKNLNNDREERLINIINFFDCKNYISPVGSGEYLELKKSRDLFDENKIQVKYLHFEHPKYKQNGPVFIEQMGIVDCIANEGYESILNLIKLGTKEPTLKPKL